MGRGLRLLITVAAPIVLGLAVAGCGGDSGETATSPGDMVSQLTENDAALRSAIDS
jgi:hypothetical protein